MLKRLWAIWLVMAAASALALAATEQPKLAYVGDLRQSLGRMVTVRGRTGVIRKTAAPDGCKVYTLRDDYGDAVDVHIQPSQYFPIMGATYDVTGEAREEGAALYLEAESQKKVYGGQATDVVITKTLTKTEVKAQPWLLPAVIGLMAAGALVVVLVVRRMVRRRAGGDGLAAPWGYVEVVSGPHQGMRMALRDNTTAVGRHLDPVKEISLDEDRSVSRRHGAIIREGDSVYYVDTNSTNGSFINERPVASGGRAPLSPGALIRVGPKTVIRVDRPEGGAVTGGAHAEDTGDWSSAQTERAPDPRMT